MSVTEMSQRESRVTVLRSMARRWHAEGSPSPRRRIAVASPSECVTRHEHAGISPTERPELRVCTAVTEMSQCDSQCDFGVSHTTPTRPDPTRPLYMWLAFHHGVHLRNARESQRDDGRSLE